MNYSTEDPIAALASAPGMGAIAVIRTSGKNTLALLQPLFRSVKSLANAGGHTLVHGKLIDPETAEVVDEVVAGVYRSPSSYTGEESVEIFCHGSMAVANRIIHVLEKNGFRQAREGEFTLRAFLNRKIDLTRAEAVNEVIRAKTDRARALAMNRLSGSIEKRIISIKDSLLNIQAAVEVQIDYPEDELSENFGITEKLKDVINRIEQLLVTYRTGKLVRDGITVVIAGSTNAGKSTLFNLLLREERAIVSDIHGTTRDYIEGTIVIEGIPVRLFDTAGLRKTDHPIEQEGIRRADQMIENADLCIYMIDRTAGMSADEAAYLKALVEKAATIVVVNKTDLPGSDMAGGWLPENCILMSAKSGSGLELLQKEIVGRVSGSLNTGPGDPVIDSERQKNDLTECLSHLREFEKGLGQHHSLDLLAAVLKDAIDSLGRITGEVTSGEILERMFSQFCVGK